MSTESDVRARAVLEAKSVRAGYQNRVVLEDFNFGLKTGEIYSQADEHRTASAFR